ncbi:hypothetical protein ABW19_dt0208857 [Dactylella cylindrospora]|nr:hypothetical protein ABW19_dt0208857 [Dactylella cylindrospora]
MSQSNDKGRKRGRPPSSSGPSKRKSDSSQPSRVTPISKSVILDGISITTLPINKQSNQQSGVRSSRRLQLSQARSNSSQDDPELHHGLQKRSWDDNPYSEILCMVCFMPFCIHHSMPRPNLERNLQIEGSQKTSKIWTLQREDVDNSRLPEKRDSFVPCDHDGHCDPDNEECSCSEEHIHCEKFCGCPPDCPRRWRGCQCRSGKSCGGDKCLCVIQNRECDPDLCLRCGADEQLEAIYRSNKIGSPDPAGVLKKEEVRQTACQNVVIQLNEAPATIVGPTTLPFDGYGLFAAEPIKKFGFIGEYKGEIITDEEADERGKVYDKRGKSYLFAFNNSHALDGMRFSNGTRYINHSKLEPNVDGKILLINGVHRIAFRALEDISPGTEFLFDYGLSDQFPFKAVEREGAQQRKLDRDNLLRQKEGQVEDTGQVENQGDSTIVVEDRGPRPARKTWKRRPAAVPDSPRQVILNRGPCDYTNTDWRNRGEEPEEQRMESSRIQIFSSDEGDLAQNAPASSQILREANLSNSGWNDDMEVEEEW